MSSASGSAGCWHPLFAFCWHPLSRCGARAFSTYTYTNPHSAHTWRDTLDDYRRLAQLVIPVHFDDDLIVIARHFTCVECPDQLQLTCTDAGVRRGFAGVRSVAVGACARNAGA